MMENEETTSAGDKANQAADPLRAGQVEGQRRHRKQQ